eukprot:TRINITY_DN17182_c1_g1_i5.p2 TRINITY_DN17182_c1_g1~~TRINITY_DN17182_c1_g1_i5.p2  ORF type:complete len:299 (-),score=19.15 TRINITY_DN17182_c1_g1_i5:194-1090(-)
MWQVIKMWYNVFNLVQNISASFAFFPPPPAYYVCPKLRDTSKLKFIAQGQDYSLQKNFECFYLKTPKLRGYGNQKIVAVFMKHDEAKMTILYSHGNATDLGYTVPFLRELQEVLKCNIFCYDYSGYGESARGVRPMVNHTLADILSCYDCLVNKYQIEPSKIVLYGESLGSGPTVWLAATKSSKKGPKFGGMVLHAPLLSGLRVLFPTASCWPSVWDVYPNQNLIKKVNCPVQIIHGGNDGVISQLHGRKLQELAPNATEYPLWISEAGHNDLPSFPQYFVTLQKFLKELELQSQLLV